MSRPERAPRAPVVLQRARFGWPSDDLGRPVAATPERCSLCGLSPDVHVDGEMPGHVLSIGDPVPCADLQWCAWAD